MRPADYIASLFKPSGGPGGESAAYDFDPIGSYFYNCPAEEGESFRSSTPRRRPTST